MLHFASLTWRKYLRVYFPGIDSGRRGPENPKGGFLKAIEVKQQRETRYQRKALVVPLELKGKSFADISMIEFFMRWEE